MPLAVSQPLAVPDRPDVFAQRLLSPPVTVKSTRGGSPSSSSAETLESGTPTEGRGNRMSRDWTQFAVPAAIGGVALLFFGLLTRGTFDPFHRVGLEVFYEGQARSILHGHLNVLRVEIDGEGILVDGRWYGYFGIVPAILRLPIIGLFSSRWPYLAPWSFLSAFAVQAAATIGLVRWSRRQTSVIRWWAPLAEAGWIAIVLGSASLFVAARPYKYEEAIAWGVAFGLAAFWAILRASETGRTHHALLAVAFAACSIGSRPTIGAGVCAALVVAALLWWSRSQKMAVLLAVGAAVAFGSYVLVNELRYHTALNPPYIDAVGYRNNPRRLALVRRGTNHLANLPTNLFQYLRPDTLQFVNKFPWITFRMPAYHPVRIIGSPQFDGIEPTASITDTMPALTLLAAMGMARVRRFKPVWALIVGGGVTAGLTLTFFGETERYLADFVPLLAALSILGLIALIEWEPSSRLRAPVYALLGFGAVWSILTMAALVIQSQHWFESV